MRTCIVCSLLVAMLAASRIVAAEPGWKAGIAVKVITPSEPMWMAGYGNRNKPAEGVAQDLFAKALVLEDRSGQKAVIVTSDLLGFPAAVAEPICERICAKTGWKREQILLNSSHTHAAPLIGLNLAGHDNLPAGDAQRTNEYTKQLQDKIVDLVLRAAAKLEPANLSWGAGVAVTAVVEEGGSGGRSWAKQGIALTSHTASRLL